MDSFRERSVGLADTLGERFRRLREEMHVSLEAAARKIGVQPKHLRAIEQGRYGDLPGPVYAKNFVRQYARFLEVHEATAIQRFEREYAVAQRFAPPPTLAPAKPVADRAILTPRGIRRGLIVLLALAVLVYLGVEVRNLAAAPKLIIASPPEELTTIERSVELTGSTDPETTVTANGKPILVDRSGHFQELLDLQDGLNTIVIRAVRKRGNATTIVRKILVQSSNSGGE
ncbi:MAG: helix-turn-helix domain-containing protein [Candidatus Kerfeldbacteria bacterium]|nr:helix-turn-helix domain-containing protein [Candidatus Kerfeldbacteria bacterium]